MPVRILDRRDPARYVPVPNGRRESDPKLPRSALFLVLRATAPASADVAFGMSREQHEQ